MTAPRRPSPPPPRRTLTDAAYSNWCVWPSSPPEPESSPPEPEQGVARPLRGSAAFRRAVAASAGGFDNEGVPGRDIHRIAPLHWAGGPVGVLDPVPPEGPGLPAGHPVRGDAPVTADHGDGDVLGELQSPSPAVTGAEPSRPAAAAPYLIGGHSPRQSPLQ